MDSRTWEKIKENAKKAHPLARIRKFHVIINDKRNSLKIREEARELARKARIELDSEQFWKWGGGSVLPTSKPVLEEAVREEPKAKKSLEETVEVAAPDVKEDELKPQNVYSSGGGDEYFGKSYSANKQYTTEQEHAEKTTEATATASEIASGEAKYHRRKTKEGIQY